MTTKEHRNGHHPWGPPIVIGLAGALSFLVIMWVVTGQSADIGRLEKDSSEKSAAVEALAEQVNRLCKDRPKCEPVVDPDDVDDPELQDLEIQDPELQEPERQEPEQQEPERNDLDPNDPESQDVDPDDPEEQDPEVDDPDANDPEFDDPENQEPEQQDPEQQDPEIDDPDPDDPDPNDEMDTFTFEFGGMTWTCTDPDNDRHWTCEPEASQP